MKTANDYLEEANAIVPRISAEAGIEKHRNGQSVFVDVRDSADIAKSGTIAGAELVARGMLEFRADDTHPFHNPALKKDADIVLICGAGGQAALSGKTLLDMGFQSVSNVGGFSAWKDAGGPTEQK
ncbi:MAG: rhodanese-like domain-containing protein [Sneathiella sp.]|uniref:rhodanese-like domain-containing protein n=1 Tax=Sulfitobacter sp. SK012 TaxID=1389005 RepID=UPI000E0A1C94|nr:rhodanese-like domain-containing protein [Sulfitobacter sp. SK012]AXI47346.1 rhodanese [Sulfitobacter sp. SK012]